MGKRAARAGHVLDVYRVRHASRSFAVSSVSYLYNFRGLPISTAASPSILPPNTFLPEMALPPPLRASVIPAELELIASEQLVEIVPLVAMERTAFISVLLSA